MHHLHLVFLSIGAFTWLLVFCLTLTSDVKCRLPFFPDEPQRSSRQCSQCDTVGQNRVVLRHQIIQFPTSLRVSERCGQTDKRVAQYLRLDSWLFWTIVGFRLFLLFLWRLVGPESDRSNFIPEQKDNLRCLNHQPRRMKVIWTCVTILTISVTIWTTSVALLTTSVTILTTSVTILTTSVTLLTVGVTILTSSVTRLTNGRANWKDGRTKELRIPPEKCWQGEKAKEDKP